MIPLGLTGDDRRSLMGAYIVPNEVKVRVDIRKLDGSASSDVTGYLSEGQVNVDTSADVTRSVRITLDDPDDALPFDTDHPADTALYFDRMMRASYAVILNGDWFPVPVFTGPVTKLDRTGGQVIAECQGKEILFLGAAWRPFTLHKGMKKTDAIRRILTEGNPAYAETRIDIPDLNARLPHAITVARSDKPWKVARHIAHSMGMQLFFDGRGWCRLRHRPKQAGFTFRGSQHVLSPVRVSYSSASVNAVAVVGAVPKGAKKPVRAVAIAPASHPLSAWRIGRFLLPGGTVTHDTRIKTNAEAQTRADHMLEDGLLQGVTASFDSVPLPFLEEEDLCHVATDDASVTFRLSQFSVPLFMGASQPMPVGYNKRLSLPHRHRFSNTPPRKRRR